MGAPVNYFQEGDRCLAVLKFWSSHISHELNARRDGIADRLCSK